MRGGSPVWRRVAVLVAVAGLGGLGCASGGGEAALPAHPFPSWVQTLEAGRTGFDEVEARFGRPDEIEARLRGGTTWRYAFREIHWPEDDPQRPVVTAEGKRAPRRSGPVESAGRVLRGLGDWLDWLLFYPPRQPRPARARALPATVHALELRFDVDGTLESLQYRPRPGLARVPQRS